MLICIFQRGPSDGMLNSNVENTVSPKPEMKIPRRENSRQHNTVSFCLEYPIICDCVRKLACCCRVQENSKADCRRGTWISERNVSLQMNCRLERKSFLLQNLLLERLVLTSVHFVESRISVECIKTCGILALTTMCKL
jgi:hypothetical protein